MQYEMIKSSQLSYHQLTYLSYFFYGEAFGIYTQLITVIQIHYCWLVIRGVGVINLSTYFSSLSEASPPFFALQHL